MFRRPDLIKPIRDLVFRRRSLFVFLPFILLPVTVIGVSLFHGDSWRDRLLREIGAWSGGEARLHGPAELTFFPPGVEAAGFSLVGGDLPMIERLEADRARIYFALDGLMLGRLAIGDIELEGARVALDARKHGSDRALADVLGAAPFEDIDILGGEILVRDSSGSGHVVRNVSGSLGFSGADGVSGKIELVWRGEPGRLIFKGGAIARHGAAATFPLRASFDSAPLQLAVQGEATLGEHFQMTGWAEASSPSLRALMRWTGQGAPSGESLQGFTARGALVWTDKTIAVDDGRFEIDGNVADGAMSVSLGGDRPFVQGTLAFEALNLNPYLDRTLVSELQLPLMHHFDADFRVSSRTIGAGALLAHDAAMTLTVFGDTLTADIGGLSICQGSAEGRVVLDASSSPVRVSARGALGGVDAESCLSHMIDKPRLAGRSAVSFDLAGAGRNGPELIASLRGMVRGRADSGRVSLDIERLLAQARSGDVMNPIELGAQTAFGHLSVDCGLAGGKAVCDSIEMTTALGEISGGAQLDLAELTLTGGVTLEQSSAEAAAGSAHTGVQHHAFVIGGSWDMPEIEPSVRPAAWPKRPLELRPARRQSRLDPLGWRR